MSESSTRNLSSSKTLRVLLIICGFLSLALGIIGILLPILPTTPFILLAALCFAKSSQRFYQMLLNNRFFGLIITEWESKHCIRRSVRYMALGSIVFTFGLSIFFLLDDLLIRIVLLLVAITLLFFLWRVPQCEYSNNNANGAGS